jgi:hypothetical protein
MAVTKTRLKCEAIDGSREKVVARYEGESQGERTVPDAPSFLGK